MSEVEAVVPSDVAYEEVPAELILDSTPSIRPPSSGWMFDCPKRGHEYDADLPMMMAQLVDKVFQVRICVKCGCPVYYQVGRVSPIVGASGNSGLVME